VKWKIRTKHKNPLQWFKSSLCRICNFIHRLESWSMHVWVLIVLIILKLEQIMISMS